MEDIYSNFFRKPFGSTPIQVRKYSNGPRSDPYSLLVNSYYQKVYEKMIEIVIKEKNIPEADAMDFIDKLVNSNDNIKAEVEKCYNDGETKKDCAHKMLDKY